MILVAFHVPSLLRRQQPMQNDERPQAEMNDEQINGDIKFYEWLVM